MTRRRLFSYPLSLALVVAALVSITGGWIAWWNYRAGLANTRELAGALFDQVAHQTAEATAAFLDQAPPAAQTLANFPDAPSDDLAHRVLAVLRANPGFAWVSYGDAKGAFTGVHRIDGVIAVNQSAIAEGVVTVTEHDIDAAGAWTASNHGAAQNYDPRNRPFYVLAAREHRATWTDPYAFGGKDGPGITYAQPIYDGDALRGVLTIDFDLLHLSKLLRSLHISEHGQVAIVSSTGTLIAHPTLPLVDAKGGLVTAPRFGGDGDLVRTLTIAGSPGWTAYVVAPESDFTAEVRGRVMSSLLISLIAVLLAVAAASLLARRISGPLTALAAEMREAGEFRIDDRAPPRSMFREIELMNRALGKMKGGLRSFARYVPRDLVRAVLASGQDASLSGETRELTVYFSDIAGFTTLAESMTPAALVQFLGKYFDEASQIIATEHGTVDKYLGDGIMAFWGAPAPLEDHASRACLAALASHRMIEDLAAKGTPISARIGIATGDVLVGNIGSTERINYTVMGDTANLASRLESLNKQYGTALMISEATYLKAKRVIVARPVDVVAVKGKLRGVRVYELLAKVADSDVEAEAIAAFSTAALDAYLIRDFEGAAASWQRVLDKRPDDKAAAIMRARARAFAMDPPATDWTGVTLATEK